MIEDARRLPDGGTLEADLCIIGAGAAGITLARSLAGTGARIVVLESGGLEPEAATQDLYAGTLKGPGTEPIDASRLRYFGGTTNHWGGWCRPLDAVDFEARPGRPLSGWPFGRETLDPFYRRAQAVCELGPFDYDDPLAWMRAEQIPGFDPARLVARMFQVSPPTRFGEAYRDELAAAANVAVWLHANALEILTDAAGGRVIGVVAGMLDGKRFEVRAGITVLATGGLENVRLLLQSRRRHPAGLGNGHDMVGRCFQSHLLMRPAGVLRFERANPDLGLLLGEGTVRDTLAFATLNPPAALLRQSGIGNFRIRLEPLARVEEGIAALRDIVADARALHWPEHLGTRLGEIAGDADLFADRIWRWASGGARSPFVDRADRTVRGAMIDVNWEQFPDRDSRVTLGPERDALGQQRLVVDWRPAEADIATFRRALMLLGLECGRLGLGRVNVAAIAAPAFRASQHHMGTTRMATDPRLGVVDADCRVHGLDNLYVAGSSVFPTSGAANPTLTIVALALRLGEHLAARLR